MPICHLARILKVLEDCILLLQVISQHDQRDEKTDEKDRVNYDRNGLKFR